MTANPLPTNHRPPQDIDATDLVFQLMQQPRPTEAFEWPGQNPPPGFEQVRVVIPPEVEYGNARLSAHVRMKQATKDKDISLAEWETPALASILNDLVQKEMVCRVYHSIATIPGAENLPGKCPYKRLFHSADDVGRSLSKDQIEMLFTAWVLAEHKLGPRFATMTETDVFWWVNKLKEGITPLAALGLPQLVELILGLHRLVVALLSTGSPNPDSPPPNSPGTLGNLEPTDSVTSISYFGEQPG